MTSPDPDVPREAEPDPDDHRTPVDRISLIISRVTMLCIPVIVVAVGYEVVMRYLFAKSTSWVNDLTVWLGAICYVVSGIYAMQRRAHIRITLLYDAVPRKLRLAFDVVALLVVLIFSFSLIVGAGPNAWGALMAWERIGTTWNPPIPATVKPLILVVIFLVAVQAVANFVADWKGSKPQAPSRPPEVD